MSNAAKLFVSDSHAHQLKMLRAMSARATGASKSSAPEKAARSTSDGAADASRTFDITELVGLTGLDDELQVQRYLYVLEGQKLVCPLPAGDLTSKTWAITDQGLDTIKNFDRLGG